MSAPAAAPAQACGGRGEVMVCVVIVNGQSFAVRTAAVSEVIGDPTLVTVPLGPRVLAGIVNHRGAMLATISLRSVLGLPPSNGKRCVVVMRAGSDGGESYGLLVDELAGVLTIEETTLEAVPPTLIDTAQRVFRGMYVREQGALVELEAEHLRPEWLTCKEHGGC